MVKVLDVETKFTKKQDRHGKEFSDYGKPHNEHNKVVLAGAWDASGYVETPNLRELLTNDTYIGHNIGYDLQWMRVHGLDASKVKLRDTMLREFILSKGTRRMSECSLAKCAERNLGTTKPDLVKKYWKAGFNTDEIPYGILSTYLKSDVSNTALLYNHQLKDPNLIRQMQVVSFAEDMIPVLADMEYNGVMVSQENKVKVEASLKKLMEDAERDLYEIIIDLVGDNLNTLVFKRKAKIVDSPKQLSEIIYGLKVKKECKARFAELTKGFNPNRQGAQKVLDEMIDTCCEKLPYGVYVKPKVSWMKEVEGASKGKVGVNGFSAGSTFIKAYLDFGKPNKKQQKLLEAIEKYSTYSTWYNTNYHGFVKYIADDGFVHGSFNQMGTVTMRLSSSSPNMQNLPSHAKDMPLKELIVSRFPNGKILQADYGQLEFCIAGELSGDEVLINDVVNDFDIHTHTAKMAFNLPEEITHKDQMNEEQLALRQKAKTKTFQFQYGAFPKNKMEQAIFDAFYGKYSKLAAWQEKVSIDIIRNKEYVCPITGKVFAFPYANMQNKHSWSTKAKNYPIQYLSSFITQAALMLVWRGINQDPNIKQVLQVHDSIVLDVAEGHEDLAARILYNSMINVKQIFQEYFNYEIKVPLRVDMAIGNTYNKGTTIKLGD